MWIYIKIIKRVSIIKEAEDEAMIPIINRRRSRQKNTNHDPLPSILATADIYISLLILLPLMVMVREEGFFLKTKKSTERWGSNIEK